MSEEEKNGLDWKELQNWSALLLRECREARRTGRRDESLRREAEKMWDARERRDAEAAQAGRFRPLAYLAAAFCFGRFESQCLALALLAEADRTTGAALAELEPPSGALTVRLALEIADGAGLPAPEKLRALEEDAPLCTLCFETEGEGVGRTVRLSRRIVAFALEEAWNDPGIPGLTLFLPEPESDAPPASAALAERMDAFLSGAEEPVAFLLQGRSGAGRRTLARAVCARRQCPLLEADGRRLMDGGGSAFRRAVMREAALQGCPVCFTGLDELFEAAQTEPETAEDLAALLKEAASAAGFSLLLCPEGGACRETGKLRMVTVPLPLPTLEESRRLWNGVLARYPLLGGSDTAALAGKYRFTPGQMERAAADAAAYARWNGLAGIDADCLARGCRNQLHHGLREKARLVESVFTWDDLILPELPKALLHSACDQVRNRPRVLDAWGFGRKLAYGSGLSMLFSGPPGTGKTMAAQVAAGELGLELYKVDLSAVVSKYVGETEKNLSAIFSEAARSQAILFFDEADVLFSKRTEVKDSHDKYNNMEAAYLLQKIEEYSGVSVLATNFLQNVDEAFKRRLKFIIEFPFPDAEYRLLLWRAVFPPQTPLGPDIDWEYLAQQFELSGSGIKNVAVNAAYLAAGAGECVGMAHLLTALKRELMKSGKLLRREDFGAYYLLAEEGEEHGGARV